MATKASAAPNIFLLPDLGEGLEEAELLEWCVKVGQHVNEFDTLAKMETDKAVVELPSPHPGTIKQLHGEPGQKIKVGAPIVTYEMEDGGSAALPARTSPSHAAKPDAANGDDRPADAGTVVGALGDLPGVSAAPGKVLAAPAVRRLAIELGVDLTKVTGTGIAGRITPADVQAAVSAPTRSAPSHAAPQRTAPRPSAAPSAPPHVAPSRIPPGQAEMRIPFRGVRRTIAERLRHSVSNAVHFTVMDEADVTALDEARRRLITASGEKISLLPFVALAVCRVLATPPFDRLNSIVDDDKNEIVQHRSIHLGIATDTENGLMVPVIRDCPMLGVLEIGRQIIQLARAARDRTASREQLGGSTFTISNVGSYAGRFATPIINYPESAILAVGRARQGVVVRGGMIGVGLLLPLSLAADHRVIDGGTTASALARIVELLQDPDQLMPPAR